MITERVSHTADGLATVELLDATGAIVASGCGFTVSDARRSANTQLDNIKKET